MSDELKCHYCGAKCDIDQGAGHFYTVCTNRKCGVCGPDCGSVDEARERHARVMPVPAFAEGPPNEPGAYAVRDPSTSRTSWIEVDVSNLSSPSWHASVCDMLFAGPYPPPAEPAEGGAA